MSIQDFKEQCGQATAEWLDIEKIVSKALKLGVGYIRVPKPENPTTILLLLEMYEVQEYKGYLKIKVH